MKALKISFVVLIILQLTASAQTGIESGKKFGSGQDSITALNNLSLFTEYAKQKNFADAMSPWTYCYENAPAASRDIYKYGVYIVKWEIRNSKTTTEREEKIDKLMALYDQRIKYFGNKPKYPEAYILGKKAIDYKSLKPKNIQAQKQSYEWLGQGIDGMGTSVSPEFLSHYMALSFRFYSNDEIGGEKLMADYEMVQDKLAKIAERGGKNGSMAASIISSFEENFANSGAADCKALEKMYAPRLEANPEDEAILAKIIDLFDKTECTDSELFYKASESMHKINPTAASAAGIAKMYLARDDAEKAVVYYNEAVSLEVDDVIKAQHLYTVAFITFSKDNDVVKARQLALQAVGANPQWGEPYILVGKMYAQSAQEQKLGTKSIENQAGFWAAVDLFNKAKQVDSKCTEEANQLINIYTNYFPSKEEIFFEPDYEAGKTAKVGGWIGKATLVRSRD